MKIVIDTSSLVSWVKYYLPFDKKETMKNFLQERIQEGSIIVLEEVVTECERQGKGQVIKALPYIKQSKYTTKINPTDINNKIYNMIDNNFINGSAKKKLSEVNYSFARDSFIHSADFAMILYAYSLKDKEDVAIVTEETGYSNDNKPFKKIPCICKIINVPTMNLPEYLLRNNLIDLSVEVVKTSLF